VAADAALVEPAPTAVLGIDETRRGKPRWEREAVTGRWRRVDRWDTAFTDLAGDQGLLGQVEGRTKGCVADWLTARTPEFRAAISYVVIDPAAVYRSAITPDLLPNARVVVDHFHLVKLANDALTDVRRPRHIASAAPSRAAATDASPRLNAAWPCSARTVNAPASTSSGATANR